MANEDEHAELTSRLVEMLSGPPGREELARKVVAISEVDGFTDDEDDAEDEGVGAAPTPVDVSGADAQAAPMKAGAASVGTAVGVREAVDDFEDELD